MSEAVSEERLNTLIEAYLARPADEAEQTIETYASRYPECEYELLSMLHAASSLDNLSHSLRHSRPTTLDYPPFLGDYRLIGKIGQGGMGVVFKAEQISLKRIVALKILSPVWSEEIKQREKFENESRFVANLEHPNIVKVFGAGHDGSYYFYAMQYIDGEPLNSANLDALFPDLSREQAIIKVGLEAAYALAYAHEHGILHRDVKPANLLMDRQGVLHVSDFGIATLLNEQTTTVLAQVQGGTLHYMAPERLMKNVNHISSDQYSLGLTLYELLKGDRAFPDTAPGALIKRICEHPLPPLEGINPELIAVIRKATAFTPSERYESMRAFAADLQRYSTHEPVMARSQTMGLRLKLWMIRRPAVAFLSVLNTVLLLTMMIILGVNHARIRLALEQEKQLRALAEGNAVIANETLQRIFERFSPESGTSDIANLSPDNVSLLSALIPYYEVMLTQRGLPQTQLAEAHKTIGYIAFRSHDPQLSEKSYAAAGQIYEEMPSSLFTRRAGAECAYQQALAVDLQGHSDSAREMMLKIVAENENSNVPPCRLVAVQALRWLSNDMRNHLAPSDRIGQIQMRCYLNRALSTLSDLLRSDRHNADYRFMFAALLGENPESLPKMPGLELDIPDPLAILSDLIEHYPDCSAYKLEFIRQVSGKNTLPVHVSIQVDFSNIHNSSMTVAPQADVTVDEARFRQALTYAEQLLARSPSDPDYLNAAVNVRQKYALSLMRHNRTQEANDEIIRTMAMLRILANQPLSADAAREQLLQIGLQRFDSAYRQHDDEKIQQILAEIKEDLRLYAGANVDYFKDLYQQRCEMLL